MKDLPALYAAVCAKRPELAVKRLEYISPSEVARPHWSYRNFYEADDVAAALILARWVEALPVGFVLYQRTRSVWECDWINDIWYEYKPQKNIGPTPLEALAAYYLGDTQ